MASSCACCLKTNVWRTRDNVSVQETSQQWQPARKIESSPHNEHLPSSAQLELASLECMTIQRIMSGSKSGSWWCSQRFNHQPDFMSLGTIHNRAADSRYFKVSPAEGTYSHPLEKRKELLNGAWRIKCSEWSSCKSFTSESRTTSCRRQ